MLLKNKYKIFTASSRLYQIKQNYSKTVFNQFDQDQQDNRDDLLETKKSTVTAEDYINSKEILSKYKDLIPSEYLRKRAKLDALYLVEPNVAVQIYNCISPYISKNINKVIAECNPGLGFLTEHLLKNETGLIKLYEPNKLFRTHLKELAERHHEKFQLYSKNLFRLSSYDYIDKVDNGKRVDNLLEGCPKKAWNDDPAISIIGPIFNNAFFQHLISALPTQTSLFSYGRVEMFAIMKPSHYWALSTDKDLCKLKYTYTVILFNTYFDYKILCKVPRGEYVPWERAKKKQKSNEMNRIDNDKLYVVHIVTKKDLTLSMEQIEAFNFFMRRFYNKKSRIVPTFEFCVPGSGLHVILPKLQHDNYLDNINIFTEFRELMPEQILAVFREMCHHPDYPESPFTEMIEADIMRSGMSDENYISGVDESFFDEMEQFDLEEDFPDDYTDY